MQDFRIVVFSDSHGDYTSLDKIITANNDDTDIFIHLGDGEKEVAQIRRRHPDITLYAVRGNCDTQSFFNRNNNEKIPLRLDIELAGKKILCVHGHEQDVKWGIDKLIYSAKENHVDIALFGHTHQSFVDYDDGLYIMNPGSTRMPADGHPSYGRIDITKAGIVTNIIRL